MKDLDQLSDEALVRGYHAGNHYCFTILIKRYHGEMKHYIRTMVYDKIQTDDLYQDSLIKIYSNVTKGNFDETKSFKKWSFMIARNTCLDYLRVISRKSHPKIILLDNYPEVMIPMRSPSPEQVIISNELRRMVHDAIGKLSPIYQDVLHLELFTGCTHVDIAQQTQLPLGIVKTRLSRGKVSLRKILGKQQKGPA